MSVYANEYICSKEHAYMLRLDRYLRVHIVNLNLWKIYEMLLQFLFK